MNKRDLDGKVFDRLSIVTIRGFEPEDQSEVDPIGSANHMVTAYGLQDEIDPQTTGIIWTDYDAPESDLWRFSVLIATDEVDSLTKAAVEAGYEIFAIEPITDPMDFGDSGAGTVEILKHRNGYVVLT